MDFYRNQMRTLVPSLPDMSLNLDVATESFVRVLVVDDSAFMRLALSQMIASESGFEVAGTACDGSEALAKIATLDPDVVTLDVQMPGLDGLATLRCIMSQFPRPVIMVSAITEHDAETAFTALGAGAFDCVSKQLSSSSLDIQHIRQELVTKIRAAAQLRKQSVASHKKPPRASTAYVHTAGALPAIVAVGASTGGPKALQEILPAFPRELTVPILIVQHMPVGFTGPFAQRLNALCAVEVREAVHNELILPGVIYIAPAGIHMTVQRFSDARATIHLDPRPEDHMHRPSIDITMKSVVQNYGCHAMGVILTGMGTDGAEGMSAIHQQGGLTIGQDEASCTVYSMPRACAELGVLSCIVPLRQIPNQILEATRSLKRA
jgi:two-component system, chemotaxis family, protein-glutamate methylesterase/glutaminase